MTDSLDPTPRELVVADLELLLESFSARGTPTRLLAALGELRRFEPDDETRTLEQRIEELLEGGQRERLLDDLLASADLSRWERSLQMLRDSELSAPLRDGEALRLFRLMDRWQLAAIELRDRMEGAMEVATLCRDLALRMELIRQDPELWDGIRPSVAAHLEAFRSDLPTAHPELLPSLDLFDAVVGSDDEEEDDEPATVSMEQVELDHDTRSLSLLAWRDPAGEGIARLFFPGNEGGEATLRMEGEAATAQVEAARLYGVEVRIEGGRGLCDPQLLRAAMDSWQGPPLSVREDGAWVAWPAAGMP